MNHPVAKRDIQNSARPCSSALVHDFFNLVCISFLNFLNILNWKWDYAVWASFRLSDGHSIWATRWDGSYQDLLMVSVFAYMVADATFVTIWPAGVKTPTMVVVHHICFVIALVVPYLRRSTHGYVLGTGLLADVNTIFLILRKLLIRAPPGLLTRVSMAAVSVCFYATWVCIRLVLFPTWLFTISVPEWLAAWRTTGYILNFFLMMPVINLFAVCLNFKWTIDLLSGLWRRKFSPAVEPATPQCGSQEHLDPDGLGAPLLKRRWGVRQSS